MLGKVNGKFILFCLLVLLTACGGGGGGGSSASNNNGAGDTSDPDVPVSTGNKVAYIANGNLFVTTVNSSTPATNVTPNLVQDGDVADFFWSADGSRIIYIADQDVNGRKELYSTLDNGSGLIKLNKPLLDGAGIVEAELSPAGDKIAYLARQDSNLTVELYVVSIDGSDNVKVSQELVAGGNVVEFKWSPDGNSVVYLSDLEINEKFELYTVSVDGSDHQKVNNTLSNFQTIDEYRWSPNSEYIAYAVEDLDKTIFSFSLMENINYTLLENQVIESFEWRSDSAYISMVNVEFYFQSRPRVSRRGYETIWVNTPDGNNLVDVTQSIKSSNIIFPVQFSFVPNQNAMAILSKDYAPDGTVDFNLVSLSDGRILDTKITNGSGGINVEAAISGLTSEQTVLWYQQLDYSPFTFSPDGRYIVINDSSLSIYDTQTSSLTELATSSFRNFQSKWIEDNNALLYFYSDNSYDPGTFKRYFIDPMIVSPEGSVIADIDQLLGGDNDVRGLNPVILGDGNIAFVRYNNGPRSLMKVGTDGLGLTELSDEESFNRFDDYQVSNDGNSIFYLKGGLGYSLYSSGVDGTNIEPLAFFSVDGYKQQPK